MLIKYYLDILAALISKAVWFLQLYISQYKELLIFIAVFVVLYIFFMHWLNVCILRTSTDGFAEQNGRDAERAD